jgi:hypothetical protein
VFTKPDIMASFFGRSLAARSPWTPEECGRFAAARDVALLAALADDRRLLVLVKRLQLSGSGLLSSAKRGAITRNTSSVTSMAAARAGAATRNPTACPAGAQAAAEPSSLLTVSGLAAVQQPQPVRQVAARQRPRKRSEAKLAERKAKFDEKWRIRRLSSTASAPQAAAVTQPGSDGLPSRPAVAIAALPVRVPDPYVRHWTDECGRPQSQMYGRCGGCSGACVLDFREEGGRGWLCEECWANSRVFG